MNISTAQTGNQPLPYTKQAIKDHLAYQATNGPAYVQFQATNAMARIMGLYEEGTLSVRQAFKDAQAAIQAAAEKAKDLAEGGKKSVRQRVRELMNGAQPTKAELRAAGIITEDEDDEDDEEGGKHDEDEPP